MADFPWVSTVAGRALNSGTIVGAAKIPAEYWELEVGQGRYTPALNSEGFATQTGLISPYSPNREIAEDIPPPIFDQGRWTFNMSFPPRSSTLNIGEVGLWLYATISANTITLTTPKVGSKILVGIASQPTNYLFVIIAAQVGWLMPLTGVIANLNSSKIVVESPRTYPIGSTTWPGNYYLATPDQITAALGGTKPADADERRVLSLGALYDRRSLFQRLTDTYINQLITNWWNRISTIASSKLPRASTTQAGTVELATNAEIYSAATGNQVITAGQIAVYAKGAVPATIPSHIAIYAEEE